MLYCLNMNDDMLDNGPEYVPSQPSGENEQPHNVATVSEQAKKIVDDFVSHIREQLYSPNDYRYIEDYFSDIEKITVWISEVFVSEKSRQSSEQNDVTLAREIVEQLEVVRLSQLNAVIQKVLSFEEVNIYWLDQFKKSCISFFQQLYSSSLQDLISVENIFSAAENMFRDQCEKGYSVR